MRFAVLGPLEVVADVAVAVERPSHRRMLSVLLLEADRAIPVDRLIDRFWSGDPPASAKGAIHTHVAALRRLLGDELIQTRASGYVLDLGGHAYDVAEFERAVHRATEAAETGRWDVAIEAAGRALELWRGPPFPDLADDAFARPEVVRLEELRLSAVETLATGQLAIGRTEQVLPDLERATLEHPLRERLWELLMTARARLGRTADALEAYRDLCGILREMGLEPGPRLRELEGRILREDPVLVPPRVRHNLPTHLTSFVGRSAELERLPDLLDGHRLITLHGPGGAGKTRLAVEVAGQLTDRYPDGVWLVDLAALRSPSLVPSAVADTLGLRADDRLPDTALGEALQHRETLLILDNAEHLLDAVADLARRSLDAGPGVSVLVTSREALGVPGELVYTVPPLAVPPTDDDSQAVQESADAVELFVQRARLVAQDLTLTDDTMTAVTTICRRLDGLPLAIELAAARMVSLSPDMLADRLPEGFEVLGSRSRDGDARHRDLRSMIDWSYRLLDPAEQTLFARLSAFAGAVDLLAVEEVCAGGELERSRVVGLLGRLVECSLVHVVPTSNGMHRYRLLETLRTYAADRLEERGETGSTHDHHRDRCLDLLEPLEATRDDAAWAEALETEHAELEVAFERSLTRTDGAEPAATLAAALARFWIHRRQPGRAVVHLEDALGAEHLSFDPVTEAELRNWLARSLQGVGHSERALTEAELACGLMEERPPSLTAVEALSLRSQLHLLVVHEDPWRAIEPAQRALEAATALDDPVAEAKALARLGHAVGWTGAVDEGLDLKRQAIAISEEIEEPALGVGFYGSMIDLLMLHPERRREEPRILVRQIYERSQDGTVTMDVALSWGWLAHVHLQSGEWTRAETALAHALGDAREGYARMWYLHAHGALRWMQGRFDEAAADVAEFHRIGPAARWYHDLYSLQADIAADTGQVEEARAAAKAYLGVEVHASEASMKTGVLCPLVRAEVGAALRSTGQERTGHIDRAVAAHERLCEILDRFPHPTGGSLQFETGDTYRQLAAAELTRLGEPDPDLWSAIATTASYAYWRLYAEARRAEALLALGLAEEGGAELEAARARAQQLGAGGIRRLLDTVRSESPS